MNQMLQDAVYANVKGSAKYPELHGKVTFREVYNGTIVSVFVEGLPENEAGNFFGFHIHDGGSCTGDASDPFRNAGEHYNPAKVMHPFHAGDLPVLLGNNGVAWCEFYTDRFYPEDVVGKSIVIHNMPDDFRSQPSGDAGEKIACGVIRMGRE